MKTMYSVQCTLYTFKNYLFENYTFEKYTFENTFFGKYTYVLMCFCIDQSNNEN